MDRIQRGLEEFLEQELAGERENERETSDDIMRREPQLYDLEEDWDSGEQRSASGRTGKGQTGRTRLGGTRTGRAQSGKYQEKNRSGRTKTGKTGPAGYEEERSRSGRKKGGRTQSGKSSPGRTKQGRRQTEKPHKSGLKKFLITVVVLIALLGVGLYTFVGGVYNKLNYVEVASVADLPMEEDGVVNVLLIGNDSRENGDDGRSDAMILLSVSSRTKTIYMTSLLRDMYVEIPGYDNNRLNAAYSFGGAELLMKTVEKNFDIPVNRYVQVNFEAFVGLVDSVGGVDLELTEKEVEYVNGYLVEYNILTERPQGTDNLDTGLSGMVHLNGPQALAYCRNRYLGTDFGRTERQRKVLTEVIKKIPMALLTNGSELFDTLMPNLTTNLTKNECFRLGFLAGKALTYDITADSIPQPGTYQDATIRKMAVLEVDFEANRNYLKEKLYGGQE